MDNEHGELAFELGVPSRTPTTGPTRRARSLEMPPVAEVIKDVNNIDPGDDFVELITGAVASCSRDRPGGCE